MKTVSAKAEEINRDWFVIDASGVTLGRLATEIARRLRGKHKAIYTPHVDTGDYIIVINAHRVRVTGNKAKAKQYYWHTGYPGGIRQRSFDQMIKEKPEQVLQLAVKGMLPRNPLGRTMLSKLKIYAQEQHPHSAQQPQMLTV